MLSQPQLRLLALFAVVVALAQASWIDSNKIFRRQDTSAPVPRVSGTGSGSAQTTVITETSVASVTPTRTSAPSTPTPNTPTPTPSASPSSTPTPTQASPSSTPPTQSEESVSSTPSAVNTPSNSASSQTSQASRTTQQIVTSTSQSVNLVTVVSTISNGEVVTSTSASTSDVLVTSTGTAVLSNETAGPAKSDGMSPKTKNTVIGVVVGVGGAIILAGLFIVAWRIWGRKRKEDENDGLMGYQGAAVGHEKPSTAGTSTTSPFQSTLENYHNPAARNVNASSNF